MTAINYQFVASGQDAVLAAFRAIPKAATQASTQVAKAADAQTKAQEKAAQRSLKTTTQLEERRWKEVQKAGKRIEAEFAKEARAAEKSAQARIRAEQRANERVAADRQKMLGKIGRLGGQALMYTAGAVGGIAMATVGAAARESIKLGELANRFSINARLAGQNVNAGAAKRSWEDVALSTPGIKSEDVGAAALAFQSKTGKALGTEELGVMATASSGLGANIEDVASAMASLNQKFEITSIDEMQQALATLGVQGAKGSFELKDAAAQFEKLSAAAQRFGLQKGTRGVAVLGGFTQVARGSTGSAEQATTAVEATMRQMIAKSGDLKKEGVNVFDKKGQARDLPTVLAEMVSKVGGKDIEKKKVGLQKILGEEGIRAVSPLITAFADATLAGKDGMQAVTKVLSDAIDVGGRWGQVQDAASQAQQDASAQLTVAWEQIKSAVGENVVPALLRLTPTISRLTESGAIDATITVFEALVEAAELVVEGLQDLGLLNKRQKTPQQQLAAAEKELKAYDDKQKGIMGPTSPEQDAERAAIAAKVAAAQEVLTPSAEAGQFSNASKLFKSFASSEEFAQQWGAAKAASIGTVPGTPEYERVIAMGRERFAEISGGATPTARGGAAVQKLEADLASQKMIEAATRKEAEAKGQAAKAADELTTSLKSLRDEASRSLPIGQRP